MEAYFDDHNSIYAGPRESISQEAFDSIQLLYVQCAFCSCMKDLNSFLAGPGFLSTWPIRRPRPPPLPATGLGINDMIAFCTTFSSGLIVESILDEAVSDLTQSSGQGGTVPPATGTSTTTYPSASLSDGSVLGGTAVGSTDANSRIPGGDTAATAGDTAAKAGATAAEADDTAVETGDTAAKARATSRASEIDTCDTCDCKFSMPVAPAGETLLVSRVPYQGPSGHPGTFYKVHVLKRIPKAVVIACSVFFYSESPLQHLGFRDEGSSAHPANQQPVNEAGHVLQDLTEANNFHQEHAGAGPMNQPGHMSHTTVEADYSHNEHAGTGPMDQPTNQPAGNNYNPSSFDVNLSQLQEHDNGDVGTLSAQPSTRSSLERNGVNLELETNDAGELPSAGMDL